MNSRLDTKSDIIKRVPKNVKTCVLDILKNYQIMGFISSGNFGDIYAIQHSKKNQDTKNLLAVKKTSKTPLFIMKVAFKSSENVSEVKLLKEVTQRVSRRSPHVSMYYKHYLCDNTQFRGKRKVGVYKSPSNWTTVKKGKAIITLMEYNGKSLYNFNNTDASIEYKMLFQLMYTLFVMQENNITHGDLYFSNITFMKTPKDEINKVWEYRIFNTSFYIKQSKYIPVIIDFGQGESGPDPQQYADYWKESDVKMLLEEWQDRTRNEEIRNFCGTMLNYIGESDALLRRYLYAKNIARDFFKKYTQYDQRMGNITQIWK
jgi:serine/threonine protein kinase